MRDQVTRRSVIAGGLSAAAALALPASNGKARQGNRVLRVAHVTDTHLKLEGDAPARFARCLEKIQRTEKPDMIFQGGDIVMDGLSQDRAVVQAQFDLSARILKQSVSVPVMHCIGNHDVYGWNRPEARNMATDPHFGKRWWLDWAGYNSTYYSFDRAGWHFAFLDSISPHPAHIYHGKLNEPQWQWLQDDLAKVSPSTPVCLVSHIPFLHAGAQFFGPCDQGGHGWHISGTLLHTDGRRMKDLLAHHPNVKLCLSGHIHMFSRVHYNGVSHVSNGAVSGCWWKGDMQETHPGYGVVDLYADGKIRSRFETY